jgi:hypothetical protein
MPFWKPVEKYSKSVHPWLLQALIILNDIACPLTALTANLGFWVDARGTVGTVGTVGTKLVIPNKRWHYSTRGLYACCILRSLQWKLSFAIEAPQRLLRSTLQSE